MVALRCLGVSSRCPAHRMISAYVPPQLSNIQWLDSLGLSLPTSFPETARHLVLIFDLSWNRDPTASHLRRAQSCGASSSSCLSHEGYTTTAKRGMLLQPRGIYYNSQEGYATTVKSFFNCYLRNFSSPRDCPKLPFHSSVHLVDGYHYGSAAAPITRTTRCA